MERELGISYPTVRGRVEALVRALGFGPRADADERLDADATGDDPTVRVAAPDDGPRSWSASPATRSAPRRPRRPSAPWGRTTR